MKVKGANGVARILKSEGIPWVSCYPTNHVNNALGEEGVPILMMGEERFAVAVADGFSRVTCGKRSGGGTGGGPPPPGGGPRGAGGAPRGGGGPPPPLGGGGGGGGGGGSRHTHYD